MSKTKVFSHTDTDGVGCAILAYLAFGRENVNVEYCDYKDVNGNVREFYLCGNPEEYDAIYITDISVDEEVAAEIDELVAAGQKWRLFDHHATALWLNQYEWCEVMVGHHYSGIKTSGTELFSMYLFENEEFDQYDAHTIENIDRFVDIVRDYDTWRWKELGEEGIICKQVNDIFHIYGREEFIEWAMRQIQGLNYVSPLQTFPQFSEKDKALLEQKQKDIDRYVEQKNKQLTTMKDPFGYTCGVVFAEQYFSELGNRLCEMNPEIDYVAMIDICHGTVSYRCTRGGIDLGNEIAHSFGGGGHKKAAGSRFDLEYVQSRIMNEIFFYKSDELE